MYIESKEKLRELYNFPKGRAKDKQLAALEKHSINFISYSPFVLISTVGENGTVDCSPRGGEPGFVKIKNEHCLILPDAKGNNRLDSLINIIETGRIGCLFLIPGVDETLRINGKANISTAIEYLELYSSYQNPPKTCIEITIEEVFLHCAKSLMRSKLWSLDAQINRSQLPTMGKMINDQLSIDTEPEPQEEMVKRYLDDL